jgi:hypothetical protein
MWTILGTVEEEEEEEEEESQIIIVEVENPTRCQSKGAAILVQTCNFIHFFMNAASFCFHV